CRRDDSKGVVSAGLQVELKQENDQWKITQICLGFGGVAPKTIEAKGTQQQLVGLSWSRETINLAYDLLLKEIILNESTPGGQIQYKRTLMQSFLFKFYSYVSQQLHKSTVNLNEFSFNRAVSYAQQTVPERPESQKIVGSSMPHQSAYLHTTGEATYIADIPLLADTLHAALILSTKANARINNINTERASKVPGFVSFVSHADVPGLNKPNGVLPDEEVFASSIALCVGAVIGLVVCETEESAELAASLIDIDYECLSPTILSIDDAIEHGSYFDDEFRLQQGDIEKSLKESEHCLEDELYIGGQEHFYMETNACIAIPSKDDQEMTLHVGVQSPTAAQELVALVLGRDTSRITCHTKRVGGAFGGKESRAIVFCLATAVAAVKVARPVRLHLDRYTDIAVTGHRHPFKIKYQVGFNHDGHIQGLDIQMWNDAGCTLDASSYVIQLAMLHMGNTYQIPNMRIRGRTCKTHLPSNTAFRGFGGPQAMLACENIIEHISFYLQCDPVTIRRQNLFREGDRTHYGQCLNLWNVPRIIDELLETSGYDERRRLVDEFNRVSIYRKRGISLVPVKFGIGFTINYLNQGGALVHIYKDGSVVISQGGIEIGQGLYTKMIAIAAEVLRCDVKRVRISETSTDKVHNISTTGGSVTADINGMAVKDACEQLRQRLDALITKEDNDISWEDLIQKAYYARVDLCGRGFYVMPNMFDMDLSKNKATYNYFTQGAAVTEVELDVLTGDWHILRVDILMDVGTSLNPQIDIGQIEGGFMQGVGLYTMEELQWGDEKQHGWIPPGQLYTLGPDTYKIPSFSDVPIDFRVSLLSNSSNPRAVFSSKGIGEPPLLFGTSAFFALKQACTAYRKQQGLENYFTLHSPASVERLRMACADEFTRRACNDQSHETFQPKAHLTEHQQKLSAELNSIINDYDQFKQSVNEKQPNLDLIKQIDQWEEKSIKSVKETADECRNKVVQETKLFIKEIEKKLGKLIEYIKNIRKDNDFNESNLNYLRDKLKETTRQFNNSINITLEQDTSQSFIRKISIKMSNATDSHGSSSPPVIYNSCSSKAWLDLQFHENSKTIKKPDEIEPMYEPPSLIDEQILNRIQGSMIGLALGDALGAHVEFRPHNYLVAHPVTELRGGGTWGLEKGQFTDDTSMALCLANSLIVNHGFNAYDQLVRYKWWYKYGYMSSTGQCFDIGAANKQSIDEFNRRQNRLSKEKNIPKEKIDSLSDRELLDSFPVYCSEEGVASSGALMRLAPVPLFFYRNPQAAVEFSGFSGQITHGDTRVYDACRYYGALIVAALQGESKYELLDDQFYEKHKTWFSGKDLHPDIKSIAEGTYKNDKGYDGGIRGKGYIVNALEAALWAFWSTKNFEDGALAAVNIGDDTDTAAAIYGQLAGAHYGYDQLPRKWTRHVYAEDFMKMLSKWIAYEGECWTK
ncbi:unnamed protein product, partial [Adineta ricciae]